MPQLDVNTFLPQVVWLVITFTALFLLMWRVAVPRIADLLEARQRRIEDNLDKAQESKKEAEETLAAYEQAMNETRAGANAYIAKPLDIDDFVTLVESIRDFWCRFALVPPKA